MCLTETGRGGKPVYHIVFDILRACLCAIWCVGGFLAGICSGLVIGLVIWARECLHIHTAQGAVI